MTLSNSRSPGGLGMTPIGVAITAGEPAGIGPELCAMLAARHARDAFAAKLVVIGDAALLAARAARIGVDPGYVPYHPGARLAPGAGIEVWNVPMAAPVTPGEPDPSNAQAVLHTLRCGADACATGAFAAMVTAPVQKSAILDAGIAFVGHT